MNVSKRNSMKIFHFLVVTLLGLVVLSCQSDDESQITIPVGSLTKSNPLTSLVSRVSQNPTFKDNVLDGTSFCSVQLPVTVVVNYNNIVVSSQEDYSLVSSIIDEYENDDDKINFMYPITMLYRNYSTIVIHNESELIALKKSYGEYEDFHEIECIDFKYPFVIRTYDTNSQIAKSISIQSNIELINFIENLKATDVYEIAYPISMISGIDGETIAIHNNQELNTAIESVIHLCDDSTGEHGDGELSEIIVKGVWHVSYFVDDTEDETSEFEGYNLLFLSNGTIKATKGNATIYGTWSSYTDDGIQKLVIDFEGTTLEELGEDWKISEFNYTSVKLKHGDGVKIDYLYLAKN